MMQLEATKIFKAAVITQQLLWYDCNLSCDCDCNLCCHLSLFIILFCEWSP